MVYIPAYIRAGKLHTGVYLGGWIILRRIYKWVVYIPVYNRTHGLYTNVYLSGWFTYRRISGRIVERYPISILPLEPLYERRDAVRKSRGQNLSSFYSVKT